MDVLNLYGTSVPLKEYYGIVMDKEKTPFVHTNNEDLLKSVIKNIPPNIELITMIEYPKEVYYCSSSLLKDIAVKDSMPNRIILLASLVNINTVGIFYLASVINVDKQNEISTIIDIKTRKEMDIPEETRRQLVADILLREGVLFSIKESVCN